MFSKTAAAFALFAASAQLVAAAVPPACLLLALEGEKNPADLPTVCGPDYKKMTSSLSEGCHSTALEGALSAYNSVCKKTPKTSSSSASKTASSSDSSTTGYGSHTPSAHMAVVTSVVYDEECSCSKTTQITTKITAALGSSTFSHTAPTGSALAPFPVPNNGTSTASAAGPVGPGGAVGTGVVPVGSQPTATGVSEPPNFVGAGVRTEMNLAAAVIAAGALAFLL